MTTSSGPVATSYAAAAVAGAAASVGRRRRRRRDRRQRRRGVAGRASRHRRRRGRGAAGRGRARRGGGDAWPIRRRPAPGGSRTAAYARAGAADHRRRAALRLGRPRVHPRPARRRRPTGGRGPSCGSAPTPTGRPRSPTAARCATSPARSPTCSRCWPPPSRCRCRPTRRAEQARAGFAAGRYPDPEPKPELLLRADPVRRRYCGVRPVDATLALLDELGADELAAVRRRRTARARRSPRSTAGRVHVEPIVARRGEQRPARGAVGDASWPRATPATRASPRRCCSTSSSWRPGEAIQLGPGNLHAYLGGAGIELMGASDNVVRGGLTAKPVDVDDLLAVARPDAARRAGDGAGRRATRSSARRSACCASTARRTTSATGHELVVTTSGAHRLPGPRRRRSTSPPAPRPTSPRAA